MSVEEGCLACAWLESQGVSHEIVASIEGCNVDHIESQVPEEWFS